MKCVPPWEGVLPMAQSFVDLASSWLRNEGDHVVTIPDYIDYGARISPPMARRTLSFGGATGGLIGYAFIDLQCEGDCGVWVGLGALIGAISGAVGLAFLVATRSRGAWLGLAAGATIVVPEPTDLREPSAWARLMVAHRGSVWHSVPALLKLLVEHIEGHPEASPAANMPQIRRRITLIRKGFLLFISKISFR